MMLEVTLGEHVAVRFDDEMIDQRAVPEQVEDYLTRMGRTAVNVWNATTNDIPVPALVDPDDEAVS